MSRGARSRSELLEHMVDAGSRFEMWTRFINAVDVQRVAEIGVYRGLFAMKMLDSCPRISSYYMLDPWRHLDDWNKPANKDDEKFERFFAQAMAKTSAHADRRVVLRGKTTEVIDQISDGALDFAYVDADHTLRGITIDLVKVFPKVRDGGWIAGDDFTRSIWQHRDMFEPTLVFPFAVYFAEAVGARIYALPYRQFLLEKNGSGQYEFVDLTGRYDDLGLSGQLQRRPKREGGRRRVRSTP